MGNRFFLLLTSLARARPEGDSKLTGQKILVVSRARAKVADYLLAGGVLLEGDDGLLVHSSLDSAEQVLATTAHSSVSITEENVFKLDVQRQ